MDIVDNPSYSRYNFKDHNGFIWEVMIIFNYNFTIFILDGKGCTSTIKPTTITSTTATTKTTITTTTTTTTISSQSGTETVPNEIIRRFDAEYFGISEEEFEKLMKQLEQAYLF